MAAALIFLVLLDTFLSGALLVSVLQMRKVMAQLADIQQSHQFMIDKLAGGEDA